MTSSDAKTDYKPIIIIIICRVITRHEISVKSEGILDQVNQNAISEGIIHEKKSEHC